MKRQKTKKVPEHEMTGKEFLALPPAERERIIAEIEAESPERRLARSTPLTPELRRRWNLFQRGRGRPKIGRGSAVVSLSIEKDLLKQADTYAKAQGLKRSELFIQGLRAVLSGKVA